MRDLTLFVSGMLAGGYLVAALCFRTFRKQAAWHHAERGLAFAHITVATADKNHGASS